MTWLCANGAEEDYIGARYFIAAQLEIVVPTHPQSCLQSNFLFIS